MPLFLKKIHVNKIFHLENFDIEIDEQEKKHLIITGKNGSGKTLLLNAVVDFFQIIKNGKFRDSIDYQIMFKENNIVFKKIHPYFSDTNSIIKSIKSNEFMVAFYEANRKTKVISIINPEKPNLSKSREIKENKSPEFLKFLVDLKIQEALARNENALEEAEKIKAWFIDFTVLLGQLFEGKVELEFNYKEYSFQIIQGAKKFGLNELSDGYSAIIDIISDLILKMQASGDLTRAYEKQGIVLIDEIETHLHLELQKVILPLLTRVFPNIQFIVTTHSPFVLSSLKNAVAFDLEKQERLDDLTEYSYEALAEGYFDVTSDSSYLHTKLARYKELISIEKRDQAENKECELIEKEFDSLNELVAPQNVKGEFLQLKLAKK